MTELSFAGTERPGVSSKLNLANMSFGIELEFIVVCPDYCFNHLRWTECPMQSRP